MHPLSVWLESRDVPAKRLGSQPKIVEGELCLVATRPTSKGQTLAAIPQKAWLTQQTVSDSPIGGFVEELDGWLQICLYLLHEQSKQSSAWGPYLASLPKEVDLPLFWSEQELQELQGTQLLNSVEGYRCSPSDLAACHLYGYMSGRLSEFIPQDAAVSLPCSADVRPLSLLKAAVPHNIISTHILSAGIMLTLNCKSALACASECTNAQLSVGQNAPSARQSLQL